MIKPPLKRFSQLYNGRKPILSYEEFICLLRNDFIIEEKIDGTLITKEHGDYLLMLEDVKYKHSVYYTKLPGRYILVDVLNEDRTERLPLAVRKSISMETGYPLPPFWGHSRELSLYEIHILGTFLERCENGFSDWGDVQPEGFVIKSEVFMNLGGKYSRLDLTGEVRYTKDIMNRIVGYQW